MADDNTQTQQGAAPIPDWLKKAQDLAQHEEKGSTAVPGDVSAAGSSSVATPVSVAVATGSSSAGSAVQTVADAEVKPAAPVPGEVADAPLPDWLKKAAEKASQPDTEIKATETVALPVNETKVPEVAVSVSVQPVVEQAKPVEPVQPIVVPHQVEPVKSADASAGNALPGWLQKIQRDGQPVAAPAVPVVSGIASVSANPPAQINEPIPVANPAVATVSSMAVPQPAGVEVPSGLLETRVVTPAKPETVNGGSAQASSGQVQTESVQAKAEESEKKIAEEKAVAGKNKSDIFKSAESAFLSFLGKSKTEIQKSQTAGAPGNDVAKVDGIDAGKSDGKDVAAGKPGSSAEAAKLPAKTPSKAAEDKATMEERKLLVEAEKIYQQGLATIRDLIAPSSMEISYDKIRIEGMYAQTFYVYTYPRYLDTNWLSPVINFDVTMDISQFIYPIDSSTIMRVLKKKVAQMQASVRINAEKGMVSDPALDTALQDAEELRTQIQRGQEKLFQFALYFTIYSEDEKKIQKVSKQLESILGGKLILTKKTEMQMEQGFNSTIPMCTDELEVYLNMNTSPLSSTFPFSSSDLTSNEGILYGLNRHNDSLIIFDRFSLENANSVVFAKSGAGKSYCVKLEILRSMMVGSDVIVIDPENEYEALAQTVGGAYLKVSLTSDRRINPFDLPSPMDGEEVQPGDLLRQNIISLHGLIKIMLGGISPEEEGIMDKALNDVYSLKGITMEVVDPGVIPPPTMEDLYDILSTMEGGQSLAQRLQKFTIGTYSGIFNKPTNVDLESGLMIFCIRDLEDALRPIAMYIILNYIWNRIRSKLKKRILVIDEAWTMMQHDDSARFLFGLVKRARKYYLGITTITQDVEDFVKSPYGKPVVTNSSMQLLLKQAPSAVDVLAKTFNLTEGEKYMLLNSGVGQGLFFAGLKHVAIQIIASYTEDKIVTTNPEEILKGRDSAQSYET